MPGFMVNGLGKGAPATVNPYYKYTWDIQQFYGDGIGQAPPAERLPLIYLKESSLPSWDFDKEEVQGASLIYKFAKSIKWNDVKVTWYDTVGLADIIRKWRRNIWTANDGMTDPDVYKKLSIIRSLTYSWESPVVWTLYNSWPGSVKVGDLTYTDSDVKVVEVTLVYDWAEEASD